MRPAMLEDLVSPEDGQPLVFRDDADGGRLVSAAGAEYPVRGGVPRFVGSQEHVESFGFQWNRFEVGQPEVDRAVFEQRAGVRLSKLAGKAVLDAGCGGGRYAMVAAEAGAVVHGADLSVAVDHAADTLADAPNALVVQADLRRLPYRTESFDLVFSNGVLHHSPDTKEAFDAIATLVKPGGRLSVWVYRRNWWPQEIVNSGLRRRTVGMRPARLERLSRVGAVVGGVPGLRRWLNHLVPFSNHPVWENRVCDTFDWYSPQYQHHHTPAELRRWFAEAGFGNVRELMPPRGRSYLRVLRGGLLIGSGVNFTGVRDGGSG